MVHQGAEELLRFLPHYPASACLSAVMSRAIPKMGLGVTAASRIKAALLRLGNREPSGFKHGGLKSLRPAGGHQFLHGRHDPGLVLRHNLFFMPFPRTWTVQQAVTPDHL